LEIVGLSSGPDRAKEYRQMAERLRGLSERAQYPEVAAELSWLAHSYDRLASETGEGRILDGHRGLEVFDNHDASD
jgi:hypothetical protein